MTRPAGLTEEGARLFDALVAVFGLSEEMATASLRRDGWLAEESGFDAVQHVFESAFGLSRGAAEIAAAGRHTSVSEARRTWDSAGSSSGSRDPLQEAQRTLDSMSDLECDMLVAEQRKRRTRVPAKKATPVKQPTGKRTTTVSETTTQPPGWR
jgi:hypothetical protein